MTWSGIGRCAGLLSFLSLFLQAQTVEIESADELGGTSERRILRGNVRLRQDTILLQCEEAQITERGDFTASGGVITYVGSSGQIRAAHLFYDPVMRRLTYEGNVQADFPPARLRAPRLHYDRLTEVIWYEGGGTFRDTTGEIQSVRGAYDTRSDVATFAGQVRIYRRTAQAHTDTLIYESWRSYAIFPASVIAWDTLRRDTLSAHRAEWDRRSGEIFLREAAQYRDTAHILRAVAAYYHPDRDSGYAYCDVRYRDRKERYFAWSDTARWASESLSLHSNASVLLVDTTDTTFIQAEHLRLQGTQLRANGLAELLRLPYRSRSDTMLYDTLKQIAHLWGRAWLTDNAMQIYAERISIYFRGRHPDSAHAAGQVQFLNEADSLLGFYHQVTGDSATARWDTGGTLREIRFLGKVQLLYYQSDERKWTGAHYARAERLYVQLDSLQQPVYVRLEESPEGTFYGMASAVEAPLWLRGLYWMPPSQQPMWPLAPIPFQSQPEESGDRQRSAPDSTGK